METTLNQEGLSFGSTELMIVLALSLIALLTIAVIYYRCRLRKAHKVIVRLLREKIALTQAGHKLLPALAMVFLLATACVNKVPGEDEMPPIATVANSSLSINTRAGTEDAVISYPIHFYVFNTTTTKCVEKKTLNNGDSEQLLFKLPAGNYTVLALAGATDENYNLPTAETAQPESAITLKAGKSHADLMTCKVAIALKPNEENTLTITLERKVMMLSSATITNMPADITAIDLSISPIRESILLNGSYPTETEAEANATHTVALSKSADNAAWTATTGNYFLPMGTNATISLSTTAAQDVKKSYSFTSAKKLEVNHKLDITANYTANNIIAMSGIVSGASWAGSTNIDFGFYENGSTAGGGDSGTGSGTEEPGIGDTTNEMPQPGDTYRGCHVLNVTTTTSSSTATTTLTLLAPKEVPDVNKNDANAIAAAITACTPTPTPATPAGATPITGWRLPTEAEASILFSRYGEASAAINSALAVLGGDGLKADKSYFCAETGSIIKSFKIGGFEIYFNSLISSATVRAVATTNLAI